MITLKDIKVSKNRIPVQNAIWLRPIGGLSFKIYYPHGGDWTEINLSGSSPEPTPTPTPTPEPTPTPKPDTQYLERTDCEKWKVIAGRCIPLNARIGNRYFFADGRLKFKSDIYWTNVPGHKQRYSHIYTYAPASGRDGLIFDRFDHVPLLRKENWNPILVTIRSEDYYNKAKADSYDTLWCKKIVLEGKTIYFTYGAAALLTCDTTSPFFKIIDGHLRNVKKPKMPVFRPNYSWAIVEAKHFCVRKLKYRGTKIRNTKVWSYNAVGRITKAPITLKRQWKPLLPEQFATLLVQTPGSAGTQLADRYTKTLMIREIVRKRKTVESPIIRRYSIASRGSIGFNYAYFKELNLI